nr:hypothetical protein CFP56_54014 [Quercus suber]
MVMKMKNQKWEREAEQANYKWEEEAKVPDPKTSMENADLAKKNHGLENADSIKKNHRLIQRSHIPGKYHY